MVVADHEVEEDGLDDQMQKWIVLGASIGEIQEQFDAVAELTGVWGRVDDLAVALVHHSDYVGRPPEPPDRIWIERPFRQCPLQVHEQGDCQFFADVLRVETPCLSSC